VVNSPKKILVMLPNNLGDVIMATPVLEGIKAKYPDCFCAYFVEDGFEAGIENNPYCDEIIKFTRKEIKNKLALGNDAKGIDLLKENIRDIKNKGFDVLINLSQHPYVSFIASLIKDKNIIGQHFLKEGNHAVLDAWSQYLYAVAFARGCNNLHAVDVYRRIAEVKVHKCGYTIQLKDEEKVNAQRYLNEKNCDPEKKIMLFQASAAFPSKRWPVENFIKLGSLLVSDGWQIVITGAPSEKDCAMGIQQGLGQNCVVTAGETTFRESLAVCSLSKGCVTGDTAQIHASAGCNVLTYAIFGPTNPIETGPYGTGHFVFSAHCPDRPCFETACKTGICMRSVLPETIYACITNGGPGDSPRCDVYRTLVEKDGDYRLIALSRNAYAYFNPVDAYLTGLAFEKDIGSSNIPLSEFDLSIRETREWLDDLDAIQKSLENYLKTHDNVAIKEFERLKTSMTRFKGIGEFWTALLNIRLNSVPLLDPNEGIKKSLEICREAHSQISSAIGHHGL
jgi:ADP-heptose:LPS heptosyltransferase